MERMAKVQTKVKTEPRIGGDDLIRRLAARGLLVDGAL